MMLPSNILIAALLAIAYVQAQGSNQRMICSPLEGIGTLGDASSTAQVIQGARGRRGHRGVKGEPGIPGLKGERGIPCTVNPEELELAVEGKLREANTETLARLGRLEQMIDEMKSTITTFQENAAATPCTDGFTYKSKCYFSIINETTSVRYREAEMLCASRGGTAADVVNVGHLALAAYDIGKKISRGRVWLGMSLPPMIGAAYTTGGEHVPYQALFAMWIEDSPKVPDDQRRQVGLEVRENSHGVFEHIRNDPLDGVLCER